MSTRKPIRNLLLAALTLCSANVFAQEAPAPAPEIKEVKIGDQIWMAENVRISIPNSFAYKNDRDNMRIYGRLYTWDAAMKACPKGWHLPSDAEWSQLSTALGGVTNAAEQMKFNGSSGFNAPMGGYKTEKGMEFEGKNTDAIYWSSTPFQGNTVWVRQIKSFSPKLLETSYDKNVAASCRCVKDK